MHGNGAPEGGKGTAGMGFVMDWNFVSILKPSSSFLVFSFCHLVFLGNTSDEG